MLLAADHDAAGGDADAAAQLDARLEVEPADIVDGLERGAHGLARLVLVGTRPAK